MPSLSAERSDFVIPKADVLNEGTKTIVKNIMQIADSGRRAAQEIGRYISKELSVPVSLEEQRLIINGRFQQDNVDGKVKKYFETYVICRECHKPDTHLEHGDKGIYLSCEACGARYWIKGY